MQLIATKPGFYNGRRVRRGESFEFDDAQLVQARDTTTGKPVTKDGAPVMVKVRPPTWAKPPVEALAVIATEDAKEAIGDTKPADARKAAKAKVQDLA